MRSWSLHDVHVFSTIDEMRSRFEITAQILCMSNFSLEIFLCLTFVIMTSRQVVVAKGYVLPDE